MFLKRVFRIKIHKTNKRNNYSGVLVVMNSTNSPNLKIMNMPRSLGKSLNDPTKEGRNVNEQNLMFAH